MKQISCTFRAASFGTWIHSHGNKTADLETEGCQVELFMFMMAKDEVVQNTMNGPQPIQVLSDLAHCLARRNGLARRRPTDVCSPMALPEEHR